MINDLMLLAGSDIPFEGAQLTIHQPTIKEIGYIGEEAFFTGVEYLKFSKDVLKEEDRINLESYTDFDILMSMIGQKQNMDMQKIKVCMEMVLTLIFPNYQISFDKGKIIIQQDDNQHFIDGNNFDEFKKIIHNMFNMDGEPEDAYNPSGQLASKIAEKLKKRRQQLMEAKDMPDQKISILNRYISILVVGEQKDMNDFMNYTPYQLFDEFRRYELKIQYDMYIQAKMAGAKDVEEVEDWMKDLHP